MNDLKFAFRQLLKNPGFTAVAVLTLALGIGANTAIFSLINAAMLKALPVKNPESIVLLGSRGKEDNKTDFGFYYPVFRKLREQNQFFDDLAAFAPVPLNVRIDGQPEPMVPGQLISGSYLSLLGVNAVAGRNIAADDDQVPGGHPVANDQLRILAAKIRACAFRDWEGCSTQRHIVYDCRRRSTTVLWHGGWKCA